MKRVPYKVLQRRTRKENHLRIDKELASLLLLLAFPASVLGAVIALSQGAPRTWVYFTITVGFLTFVFALVKLINLTRDAGSSAQEIVDYFEDLEAYPCKSNTAFPFA